MERRATKPTIIKTIINIILFIIKLAVLIWLWQNKSLLYGVAGWLLVDLLIISFYLALNKGQREYIFVVFMSGVRRIEYLLFGHFNEIDFKGGKNEKITKSIKPAKKKA